MDLENLLVYEFYGEDKYELLDKKNSLFFTRMEQNPHGCSHGGFHYFSRVFRRCCRWVAMSATNTDIPLMVLSLNVPSAGTL